MAQPKWVLMHPRATVEMLGIIPSFLDDADPRPAADQIDTAYISGWTPTRQAYRLGYSELIFPGDAPYELIAYTHLGSETIRLFRGAWVAIIQANGMAAVSKID